MSTGVEILFVGEPLPFGGLSNEDDLAKSCPGNFKDGNPWSEYAMKIFFQGGYIGNWKWKSADKAECSRQKACFFGLLGTFGLKHQLKEAVAGWMLSEMLTEVPEYIKKKPTV